MDRVIRNRWWRLGFYIIAGALFKFILDVVLSLLFRNYSLLQPFEGYVYAMLLSALTLEAAWFFRDRLGKRVRWDAEPYRRYLLQWLLSLASGVFFIFGVRWIGKLAMSGFHYVRVLDEVVILVLLIIGITVLVTTELVLFLLNKWRFSLAELERFKKENAEFQFESLRSQVNPHFLFNSLNTLSSLIYEDQEKAEAFIRELSDVYRYILENRGRELVAMEQEMALARSYVYLVQLRFEKNLEVHLEVPPGYNGMRIAPLTLQLLIENAVKHNVISRKRPLRIDVTVEKDTLTVRNNLQKKESREYSSQLGLKNIRSRYAYLTDDPVIVQETESEFIVKIPLIHAA